MTNTIKYSVGLALCIALLSTAFTVYAGGSHAKATGDVTWTSKSGVEGYRTVFNAHEDAPGAESDRGSVTLYHPVDGHRAMNVECALVQGNEAWFAGTVNEADGAFAGQEGAKVIWWVKDNGKPNGDTPDEIGATKEYANPCSKLGIWRGGGTVTDGNLKVKDVEVEV